MSPRRTTAPRKPFARVTPLTMAPNVGRYAVESGSGNMAARWGVYDTPEEAAAKADALNAATAP